MNTYDQTSIRLAGEEVAYDTDTINNYIRCKTDIIYFAENYCHIVTLDKGKRLIKLWEPQKKVLKAVFEEDPNHQHRILLSSRQVGKTTLAGIYLLHSAIFNDDKNIAILANKERTALGIMRRIKIMYQMLPKWLKQGIVPGGWNKKTIQFENGSIISASATSSSAIRSESVNILYIDEMAFIPQGIADEFMASVYPTIVSGTTTKMILVSTANGINHFYHLWADATRNENSFLPIKVMWNEIPGRDEKYKQKIIKDIGMRRWLSEFECKFFGTANSLIDGDILTNIVPREVISYKWNGAFLIYEQPIEGVRYVLGVDTGKGIGKDASVVQVLKIIGLEKIEQVASYSNNKINPRAFAKVVVEISKMYNEAYMMIENNGREGAIITETLLYNEDCDKIISDDGKELGILSSVKKKFKANMHLKDYIEKGYVTINDASTINELSKYDEVKPNIFKGADKSNDDKVTSLMWGVFFVEYIGAMGLIVDPETRKFIDDAEYMDKYRGEVTGPSMVLTDDNNNGMTFVDSEGVEWSGGFTFDELND